MYQERVLGKKQIGSAVRAVCAMRGVELSLVVDREGNLTRRRKLDTDVHCSRLSVGRYSITVPLRELPFVTITPINDSYVFCAVVNICTLERNLIVYQIWKIDGGNQSPYDCSASVLIRT